MTTIEKLNKIIATGNSKVNDPATGEPIQITSLTASEIDRVYKIMFGDTYYVVYDKESTYALKDKYYINIRKFASKGAAKAAITRMHKKGNDRGYDWQVAEYNEFKANIEKRVTRTNLMSGQDYEEPVNTPSCCSPASETYWSM